MQEKDIVNTKKILELLNVSYPTFLNMKKTGMPFIKFGAKTHRYSWSQVKEWLENKASEGAQNGK